MASKAGKAQKGLIDGGLKEDLVASIHKFRDFQLENNKRLQVQTNSLKFSVVRSVVRKERGLFISFIDDLKKE